MKRNTWIATLAVVIAGIALLAWAFAPRPLQVETAAVTRGRFEATLDEDGKTRLRDRYVVSAPLAGLLTRMALREGDAVQAGMAVATLMPALSPMLDERRLREQRVQVEIAEANVQRVQARIARARVALLQARNDLQRSEQLARQGFIAPTKLENDRLAAEAAQKELDAAAEEGHVAGHEVEQARAAVAAVQRGSSGERAFVLRARERPGAEGDAGQRGHGGAGHAAAGAGRHRAHGDRRRDAHH
jgi:HlyD family secretion protein